MRGVEVLTPVEIRAALEHAERRFTEACADATDSEWQFQPPGVNDRSWTIPQVVEHVTGANTGVLRRIQQSVVSSPLGDRTPDFLDADLPYIFYGGGGPAPPGVGEPTGTAGRDESIAGFRASMRAILDWYATTDVDLRSCGLVHPAFGLFDGAQWLLFVVVHTQQHRGQILDNRIAANGGWKPQVTPTAKP
jgi:hypothetical protein